MCIILGKAILIVDFWCIVHVYMYIGTDSFKEWDE